MLSAGFIIHAIDTFALPLYARKISLKALTVTFLTLGVLTFTAFKLLKGIDVSLKSVFDCLFSFLLVLHRVETDFIWITDFLALTLWTTCGFVLEAFAIEL